MAEKVDINLFGEAGAVTEVLLREGKALELKEPVAVRLSGTLPSPLDWLTQRVGFGFEEKQSHLLVDRANLSLTLICDEKDHYRTIITGKMEFHPLFLQFGINTNASYTTHKLADLLKMNRSAFETRDIAMNLVSTLKNFQAKIAKEVESSNDNRGNRSEVKKQAVESNLPDAFKLKLPIFKGTPVQEFEVEVYVDADDMSCSLVSPAVNDIREELRNTEIDRVLTDIRALCPGLAIIEQ